MKIALIHIRLMNKGGLETRLINYMNYFLQEGHEVSIISSKISNEIVLPPSVEVIAIDLSKYMKFSRHLFFNFKVEALLAKSNFDYTLSLERTWCQDHLIAPNTHIGYLKAQHQWWRDPSDLLQLYLDKRSFRTVKHIYACSQMVKDEIVQEYEVDASKIKVVFPPLNTQKFNWEQRKQRQAMQTKYQIDDTKINFLFVSTSHKRKGLNLLLSIFSRPENRDKHLYIAGSKLNFTQKNIHSLGFVTRMQDLYVAVDITLHPAVYEPFGQIVSESIACGTYVLVSDKVGAKEIIKHSILGQVLPMGDISAWNKAITDMSEKKILSAETVHSLADMLSLENHMKQIFK